MEVFNNLLLFTVIFCLAINVVITIFGFFNIRNMRERWITGVVQILTIFFVLLAPSFKENLRSLGGFLIVLVFAGLTSVLSSRTLAYMVKAIKARGILWILTILFSIFAPVLFALLMFAIYRFAEGEENLGILLFAFYGGCIVASVAFIVNVINIMEKGRI